MKSQKLHSFIKLHSKANAIVLKNELVCELITFNDYVSIEKYQHFLEKRCEETFFAHLEILVLANGDSANYLKCLQNQFGILLTHFFDHCGYLLHRKLTIKNKDGTILDFDELTDEVKHKVSSFISVQKCCLNCFLSKLDTSEKQYPGTSLKWNATKTDLVELANALFEGGFVSSESGAISKKDFMKQFSNIFNIDLSSNKILLSKAMVREKSATFIHKLNSVLTDYYDNLLNQIKG